MNSSTILVKYIFKISLKSKSNLEFTCFAHFYKKQMEGSHCYSNLNNIKSHVNPAFAHYYCRSLLT